MSVLYIYMKKIAFIILIIASTFGDPYPPGGDVIELTLGTFGHFISIQPFSVIQFYSPLCRVCNRIVPTYRQSAALLKSMVKFAAVDCAKENKLAGLFSITAYPTIAFFRQNETYGALFNGTSEVSSLLKFVLDNLDEIVAKRARKEAIDWKLKAFHVREDAKSGRDCISSQHANGTYDSESNVINLTEDSFNKLVLHSEDQWMVEFYIEFCSKCSKLKKHWELSAKALRKKMKFGAVNADIYGNLANKLHITTYPKIKYFSAKSELWQAEDFRGGLFSDSIIFWATNVWSQNKPSPQIIELTSYTVLEKACYDTQLCIIGVLPKLFKCDSKCRKKHLKHMKSVALRFEDMDWGWIWTESETHPDLEEKLELEGFDLPAIVAVNVAMNFCKILTEPFNYVSLTVFSRELVSGKGPTPESKIDKLPMIKTIRAWNGEDEPISQQKVEVDSKVKTEL